MGGLTNAGTPTVNAKEAVSERPVDIPEPSPEWIRPRRVKGIRMCVLPECTSAACTTCVEHETPVQEPALEWKTPAKSCKIKFSKSSEFNESIHAAKSYANSFAALGEPEKESPDVASESQLIASACKYTKPNNSSSVSNLMQRHDRNRTNDSANPGVPQRPKQDGITTSRVRSRPTASSKKPRRASRWNRTVENDVKMPEREETAAESLDRDRDEGVIPDAGTYKYAEDYGPIGPAAQWEILKHSFVRDYEPTEEVYMSATQRALAAMRRRDARVARLEAERAKTKDAAVQDKENAGPMEKNTAREKLCPITEARGQEPAFAAAAQEIRERCREERREAEAAAEGQSGGLMQAMLNAMGRD